MRIPKVGRDVGSAEFWEQSSEIYKARIDGPYHAHRLEVITTLLPPLDWQGAVCVDVGCGDGVMLERLARLGARVSGFDPNRDMVEAARRRLAAANLSGDVTTSDLRALTTIADRSVDCVLALNVLAYFSDDEAALYYTHVARILKPGGSLVVTHSNELFDLYALNAFTLAFFEKHFCGPGSAEQIASLLAHPDVPERPSFNIRENPLTYRFKLAGYGLDEVQQEFANLHSRPPLLMDPRVHIDIDSRGYPDTLNVAPDRRWTLLFTSSMFGSRSVRRRD
jgi:2-polyprenyl-3-methyl-5-hydroxy-6-metoxy-1,4-benzoquinol methylase